MCRLGEWKRCFLLKYIYVLLFLAVSSTTVILLMSVEGVWKSTPDVNGLVVHRTRKACGQRCVGQLNVPKTRRGYDKRSTRLVWAAYSGI